MKISTLSLRLYMFGEALLENFWVKKFILFSAVILMSDPSFAGVDGDMKASVEGLQKELFGSGWVTVGKIGAAAAGVVMSIAKMNAMPFVVGGLSSAGIHFFQKYTEAAAGCLLSVSP